jgi:hypothetical protein
VDPKFTILEYSMTIGVTFTVAKEIPVTAILK